jgi:hypothetical protein
MPKTILSPDDHDDLVQTIAFGLQFEGRKRVHHADSTMAMIAARKVVEHLLRCGYVVTKGKPAEAPRAP